MFCRSNELINEQKLTLPQNSLSCHQGRELNQNQNNNNNNKKQSSTFITVTPATIENKLENSQMNKNSTQ